MIRLPPMPTIKEVLRLYNLRAQKHLSQNFLLNPRLIDRFVSSAGDIRNSYVVEVGPGPGGITRAILEKGAKQVVIVEKDRRFMPGLELLNEASKGKLQIYLGDVMQFNMAQLFPDNVRTDWMQASPAIHILGNLPFNISTILIIRWMEAISTQTNAWSYGRTPMTLTFQKEVAERIVAPIDTDQRARLSVMCQTFCHVKHIFDIKGRAFLPPPDVDVGVVQFIPRERPLIDLPFKLIEKVVRHTFHYRQKKCKRGVQTLFPPDEPELTVRMFQETNIDPSTTPYRLTVKEFRLLCYSYHNICMERPELLTYDYRSKENAHAWRYAKPLSI